MKKRNIVILVYALVVFIFSFLIILTVIANKKQEKEKASIATLPIFNFLNIKGDFIDNIN